MLKVSPWKGVVRFGKRGKLNNRYVRPFKVLERNGSVAYKLELPQELSRVHNTFHVSNLKKCYSDEPLAVPLEGLHIDDKLQFVEEPVEIMEREIKRLKRSRIPLVKVRWNSRRGPEFTWEREDSFKKKYPHLFTNRASSSTTTGVDGVDRAMERWYRAGGEGVGIQGGGEEEVNADARDTQRYMGILKDGGEVKEFQRSFCHSDTERLSRSDEVLKLKNFKKDATLKLSKSTNQEWYEHVGLEVTRSQDDKVTRWRNEIMLG
ncbi:hypothetical protein Tco_1066749 [Tanacetum coccineum]|uniref:Tf2-1-like SH3-like domain-containing protein n=1 Tax=Tanacetum coccineum TaxID=301880 RepID=A0ABQ5HCM5_9ASTR